MAKRVLSEDYRRGATRAQELLVQWSKRCRADSMFAMRFPDTFRAELSAVAGDVLVGLEDGFAVYLRSILEDMPLFLEQWDPVLDLEDPDSLYGVEE
ncbi:hypothetical protein [Burkholderia ubonensis]|uniref:hypothetical protein n=1 Tax=Burkholderia ubonensis TaxID=101571 RepID=UPI00075BAF6A|nr:hypothetical protein [Burkholderia ubonensis]KVD26430.1 hypothetical protein WI83_25730 [Burkholderia ubonensis]